MNIQVVCGRGTGKTKLSAFDNALKDCGVYNYNLIVLSSIIPPDSYIEKTERYSSPDAEYGHRLYVIKSERGSEEKGTALAAGLGWYQVEGNKGVFVEHNAEGKSEEEVRGKVEQEIKDSLSDLCAFRGYTFDIGRVSLAVTTNTVGDKPACALTIAVYQSQCWLQ